ncbi:UDP-glycosyltransferase 86A1 isoform X1 [Prunus yedoensis var. nudiflora]|uniref:UDP-glycosyltransferase 86A1 isoform X1 n=1 Tax=Prunus yedoensis var. nudiflora TaxID=2094558 RepID=A0A314YPG7_PRUYE|nr:UDP-glycosyltransferase 86A1 isoform X1 [Prunus yedoensis var. nudiflora]PQQ07689.1 UDP-glycosyltransferase 86A1 isoform X1 [Prunus yedoensis var. nudiflora]
MSEFDCTEWLNTKPNGSVLFVSFGSYVLVTKNDIEEIAHGLLLSKVSFIWVLRPNTTSYDETYILPVGFENEIKDRGLMLLWCSQIEVLSHPTTRGVKPITRVEVAEKINRLMSGKLGKGLQKQSKKVKQTLEDALAVNGSSQKNLSQFIGDVKAEIQKRV